MITKYYLAIHSLSTTLVLQGQWPKLEAKDGNLVSYIDVSIKNDEKPCLNQSRDNFVGLKEDFSMSRRCFPYAG